MAPIVGKLLNTVGYTTGRGTDGWDTDLEPSLRKLDALVQGNAIAFVNTLPAPVEGATYIIGTSPTGIAAGWANRVVRANAFAGTWDSWVPVTGWRMVIAGVDHRWSGTAWTPTGEGYFLPISSSDNVPFSNFGGVGAVTANSYWLQTNKGVALADARGLNWRGGFVSTDTHWGLSQDASVPSSFKPFVLQDGRGSIWYKNDPKASAWNHEFYGNTKFQSTVAMAVPIAGTTADLDFRSSDALRRMTVRWNVPSNRLEIFSNDDAGTAVATRMALPRDSASPVWVGLGMNVASGALQIGGVEVVSSGRQAEFDKLTIKKAIGTAIGTASRVELVNADATWGGATWMDSGANMRMAFFQNDATWTDRYVFGRSGNLNILSGSLQLGGVDTITATREGRFTGLRLTNLSAGQIPVASDANGQITASGLTDDGIHLTSTRVFRFFNTLTKSGNTWTAFQWAQNAEEKLAIFSSDQGGLGGYATIALAPLDTDLTGRNMGNINWVQRLSGKSGTNPGIKVAMYAQTVGAGGSIGGFGGKWRLAYRPDNGTNMVDALRVGAFGSGTADAVEAAILLRANAGIQSDYIRLGVETQSGSWAPSATTKRIVRQTGAGTITFPVNCSAFAGMEFVVEMAMTSVAAVWIEKDTHGATDRYFFRTSTAGSWEDVYTGANRQIQGRLPINGTTIGETSAIRVRCDGNYWWIECD